MDGSLIVILGFPALYITGSLHKAAALLKVKGVTFVLYFLCTAALLLLPRLRVANNFSVNFAGLFYCFAPVALIVSQRKFPVGLPVAAALCVLASCIEELVWGDYTISYLPYIEGTAIAIIALSCLGRRAALFAPVLAGVYEASAHTVRLITGLDTTAWLSGICAASVAIALSFFACAVRLRRPQKAHYVPRHASQHAQT